MEKILGFTQEHLSHIRGKGFRPLICSECREIDEVLEKLSADDHLISDLYDALKIANKLLTASSATGMRYAVSDLDKIDKALAKANGK